MNFVIFLPVVCFMFLCVTAQFPLQRKCGSKQFECDNGQCVNKTAWCHSNQYLQYCGDRSERKNCGLYYPRCAADQTNCFDSRKRCIPKRWICDGFKDCSDGSDEDSCLDGNYRIFDIDGVLESRNRSRLWLLNKRRANYGWGKDTHRAIVALYLSNMTQFHSDKSLNDLTVKQLQLQLSEVFLRNGTNSFPNYEMALYIHALLATCLNPKKFQGYDLVEELKNRMNNSDAINPLLALAICNSNKSIPNDQIMNLIEILLKPSIPQWTDSQAIATMALICLQNRNKSSTKEFNQSVNETIFGISFDDNLFERITRRFILLQEKDGSFGNLHTTALILQALMASNNFGQNWNPIKTFKYIVSQQKPDGSFGDILTTYLILPIMYRRTLLDLCNVNCTNSTLVIDKKNVTVKEELDGRRGARHRVNYQISVGFGQDVSFSLSVNVPIKSTFYDVMRLASELDDRYRFQYIQYIWGKYVYSIFGVNNDPEAGKYWELYQIKQNQSFFVDKSPDRIVPRNNDIFVYWYKSSYLLVKD